MDLDRGFSARNRTRIAVVILLATVNYVVASAAAAVATTLAIIVGAVFQAGDIPDFSPRVIGWVLGGIIVAAAVIGGLVALVRLPFLRRNLEERVLIETGAAIATADQHRRIGNLLEGLAIAAGVTPPRFAVIDATAPNSFGVGTKPDETIVAVTTGMITALSRDELEAVLAYEVSRIGSWDVALASWTVALTGGAIEAVDDKDDGPFHTLFGFLPRRLAQRLQVFAMKGQVQERDRIALSFTRNPAALVRALEKLHADPSEVPVVTRATGPLWLEFPEHVAGRTKAGQRLARELSLDGRIAQLRAGVAMSAPRE